MQKSVKRLLTLLLAAVLVLITACSGGGGKGSSSPSPSSSDPASSSSPNQEQITLRVMWWGSQTRHDLTNQVIELYEKRNPHVKIEAEFTSFDGYWEKLAAMVSGNNMPDVLQMNFGEYLTQYAEKDVLLDLNEVINAGLLDVSKVSESILESGVVNGKNLGIALGMNALTVIYDEEMLKKANAKLPSENWTWDDWKEIAEAVKNAGYDYGTQTLDIGNIFEYYARQHGQKLFNDTADGLGFEDELLAEFLTMLLEQQKKGTYPTLDVASQHQAVEDQLIVHGKAPFDFRWSNQVVALTKAANRPLKLAPLPGPDIDKGLYLRPALFFSIAKDTKHKEEAAKFIDFFINDLEANKILSGERGVPVVSTIREELAKNLDEVNQMIYDYIDWVAEHSSPIDSNYPPGSSEVLDALKSIHEQVMYEQLSPADGAKEFRKQAEDIIKRNLKK